MVNRLLSLIVLSVLLIHPVLASEVLVENSTQVLLDVPNVITTDTVKTGDTIQARVLEAVIVDGQTVFKEGAKAELIVEKSRDNGILGRPGKLSMNGGFVYDVNGEPHPIGYSYSTKGDARRGLSIAGTVLSVPLVLILVGLVTLPIFVGMHGKDAQYGGQTVEALTTSSKSVAIE